MAGGRKETDLEGANDMFRRDSFLRVLFASLIRLGRNEVDEFYKYNRFAVEREGGGVVNLPAGGPGPGMDGM